MQMHNALGPFCLFDQFALIRSEFERHICPYLQAIRNALSLDSEAGRFVSLIGKNPVITLEMYLLYGVFFRLSNYRSVAAVQ